MPHKEGKHIKIKKNKNKVEGKFQLCDQQCNFFPSTLFDRKNQILSGTSITN